MEPNEQEPLMWSDEAEHNTQALIKQLRRLVAHHNDINPTQRIDMAKLELHFPEYQMTQWHELSGYSRSADGF